LAALALVVVVALTPVAVCAEEDGTATTATALAPFDDESKGRNEKCHRVVTYNAGYFLTEGYGDYPFFMGFIDVSEFPASSSRERRNPPQLVEWAFTNNETLISVTPETLTAIESSGSSKNASGSPSPPSSLVRVATEVDHFKFIAHRDSSTSEGLDPPEEIYLNGQVCEEIVYSDVVEDPDTTVRASAHSRELAEGVLSEQEPSVLLFYQPDEESLSSQYPKLFTKFNFSIVNTGAMPLEVSTVSVKYYFKNPGSVWLNPSSDEWKVTFSSCMEVYGTFHNPTPIDCGALGARARVRPLTVGDSTVDGADYVLEIFFEGSGGEGLWLSPLEYLGDPMILDEETGQKSYNLTSPTGILVQPEIQLDSRQFFLRMNETEDYSFRPPAEEKDWIINQNISVEVSNRTIWGTDLEALEDSKRFELVGMGQLGIPGGNCNQGGAGNSSYGVGCMVIKRYCCRGVPTTGDHGVAPMHGDGTSAKLWIYIVLGLVSLVVVAGLLLGIFLYKRSRALAAQKGEKPRSPRSGADRISLLCFMNPAQGRLTVMGGSQESLERPLHHDGAESHTSARTLSQSSLRDLQAGGIPGHRLDGKASLQELNGSSVSTESPDPSPTSALGMSIFKNPFAILPQSPKLPLPNIFKDSTQGDLFEVINPNDVKPLRYIGSGAYGSVYEALFEKHGRVAVKLVNIRETSSKTMLESFKREVDVLSRVKHQNVVNLHGACMCPPNVFIVMELLKGSLRDRLDEVGRMTYREILTLANEISSALAYLHPTIVHRDLKPQNILIDGSGSAKVADFGIAKFKQSTYLNTTKGNGTPAYMAPESFGSDRISEKADVYSLGMILWECWTGNSPWKEVEIPFQVVMLVGVEKKRPEIPSDCPRQLASLIQRCWDDDPHRRPSCAEVERRTRLLLHELEAADAAPLPPDDVVACRVEEVKVDVEVES